MRVIVLPTQTPPFVEDVPDKTDMTLLESLRQLVDGHIEPVRLQEAGTMMLVDEEAKLKGKPDNVHAHIAGQAVIVGLNEAGTEWKSLTDDQIAEFKKYWNHLSENIKPYSMPYEEE